MAFTVSISKKKSVFISLIALALILDCAAPELKSQTEERIPVKDSHYPHHVMHLPKEYPAPQAEKRELGDGRISIDLYAKKFTQGNALYIEIFDSAGGELTVNQVFFGDRRVLLAKRPWGYRGIIPVHPNHKPGKTPLSVSYTIGNVRMKSFAGVDISAREYQVFKTPLDVGKYSNVDSYSKPGVAEFIKKSLEKKQKVFSAVNPDALGQASSHPRDMHFITSEFWSKRLYLQYRYKNKKKVMLGTRQNIHQGIDFRGVRGAPVFALADGLAALADNLYYEGNFLVLDHGNRVFSYYMHMNDFTVKTGDKVKAGDLVGHVGSSGLSTGAHLHMSLMIQGIQVDPLSFIPLPIKD